MTYVQGPWRYWLLPIVSAAVTAIQQSHERGRCIVLAIRLGMYMGWQALHDGALDNQVSMAANVFRVRLALVYIYVLRLHGARP